MEDSLEHKDNSKQIEAKDILNRLHLMSHDCSLVLQTLRRGNGTFLTGAINKADTARLLGWPADRLETALAICQHFSEGERIFSHGGDLGDIVFALSTVKHLGGGHLVLCPHSFSREKMSKQRSRLIAPLLESQSYLKSVLFSPTFVDTPLIHFRRCMGGGRNIAQWHAVAYDQSLTVCNEPWLTVAANPVAKVIFSRSPRYRSESFPWKDAVEKYAKDAVFVGVKSEHEEFTRTYGHVPYHPTKDLLQLAEVIAGASLFIGNQSAPQAIAEGLKKPTIMEACLRSPSCDFRRGGQQVIYGGKEKEIRWMPI